MGFRGSAPCAGREIRCAAASRSPASGVLLLDPVNLSPCRPGPVPLKRIWPSPWGLSRLSCGDYSTGWRRAGARLARVAPGGDQAVRGGSPRQPACLSCLARAWEVSPDARSRAAELRRACPRASRLSGQDRCTSVFSLGLPRAPRARGSPAGGHGQLTGQRLEAQAEVRERLARVRGSFWKDCLSSSDRPLCKGRLLPTYLFPGIRNLGIVKRDAEKSLTNEVKCPGRGAGTMRVEEEEIFSQNYHWAKPFNLIPSLEALNESC